MKIKEDCFAYREVKKEKEGFSWKENKCDCLTEFLCDHMACPFYKPADSLSKYEYKIYQTKVEAYRQIETK